MTSKPMYEVMRDCAEAAYYAGARQVPDIRVCRNCGLSREMHSTTDICPRLVKPDEDVDPSGASITWWSPA